MKLLWLDIRNFMRFRKARLKLSDAGMTLIEGINRDDESATSNGAGKSTIVDAIVWCLYGVTTHEPSAQGDDVVNERRGRNCEVSVTFRVGKYQHYQVTRRRAWKKGGRSVQLELNTWDPNTQGGAAGDMTKGTIRDTQATIEKLIGMSVATFRHSCVFGQGRAYRFSRLTDAEKKAVLDEMLGSEVYARAGDRAAKRLVQMEQDLGKAETALETALETLQEAQTRLARAKARAERDARQARKQRVRIKRQLGSVQRALKRLRKVDERAARKDLTQARAENEAAIGAWHKARRMVDDLKDRMRDLETQRDETASQEDTKCVTCSQLIGAKHVAKQLRVLEVRLKKYRRAYKFAQTALDECERTRRDKHALVQSAEKHYDSVRDQANERVKLQDKELLLERALADIVRPQHSEEEIVHERVNVKRLKARVAKLRRFVKHRRRKDVAQLRFWQQGFSAKGLRSLMLDSTLPFLNAKVDQYTKALTAGNIEVEFRTQRQLKGGGVREDFHVHVSNRHGSAKYNMNSVGERAKIDLVVGLALQDMAASRSRVPVNVAFFDEVFDGIDAQGVDRVVQVLSQLNRESAFVISHNSDLKSFFSRRLTVIKEHGESRLESS